MRNQPLTYRSWRRWLSPAAAIGLCLGLILLPPHGKAWLARALENSFFYPFRFVVGWGPRSLQAQRECLKMARELAESRLEVDTRREAEAENARLRSLLGFSRRASEELLGGLVVGRGRLRLGDFLVVQLAEPGSAEPGQAVLAPDGLVGRVQSRQGSTVRVACLSHLDVSVSVINQRNREGGILKWDPLLGSLVVEGIPAQADWQRGDRLVTSGLGLAFPKGILVGWVVGERLQRGGLLKTLLVRPAARPAQAEDVFILRSVQIEGKDLSGFYPTEAARGRPVPGRVWVTPAAALPSP